jgi:hypothetical protein
MGDHDQKLAHLLNKYPDLDADVIGSLLVALDGDMAECERQVSVMVPVFEQEDAMAAKLESRVPENASEEDMRKVVETMIREIRKDVKKDADRKQRAKQDEADLSSDMLDPAIFGEIAGDIKTSAEGVYKALRKRMQRKGRAQIGSQAMVYEHNCAPTSSTMSAPLLNEGVQGGSSSYEYPGSGGDRDRLV